MILLSGLKAMVKKLKLRKQWSKRKISGTQNTKKENQITQNASTNTTNRVKT